MMRGEEEHLEEASGKLYTKDVVIQDCNAYIKQVQSLQSLQSLQTSIFTQIHVSSI